MNRVTRDKSIYCEQGPQDMAPTQLGQLTGLSFVFKDLFDVKGYKTGAGNPAWLSSHEVATETSPLISTLLASGAECLGRVQTDELAYSLNGQNVHYGTPVNPLANDSLPGGSSSGSAVVVANKDADFSIGTDTGGSIRVPSSYCGLFGLRPTLGKLSLDACFELSKSFDTAGVMARSLDVLELVVTELGGLDSIESFPTTLIIDNAVLESLGKERSERLELAAKDAGITLERVTILARSKWEIAELSELFRTIQGFEIIRNHKKWLDEYQLTLDKPIQERVTWARTITPMQYEKAKIEQEAFAHFIEEHWFSENVLVVLPTTPGAPPKLSMEAELLAQYRSELMGLTAIGGLCGLPQLHMPMSGLNDGPAGISLLGNRNQEKALFHIAAQLLKGRETL